MLKLTVFLCLILYTNCKTHSVSDDKELLAALKDVSPGDTIELADGKYHNTFVTDVDGKDGKPITLTGSKKAVISGSNYGFHHQADYWVLQGFTVANSKKGIVLDGASNNILEDLEVHDIQQEGIHFRKNSADNILRKSYIHTTGLGSPGYGEGVYIGSAVSNWESNKPDKSDRNQILNNRIGPNVAAEEIDIKEGSCCGIIKNNVFDGTGMSGENYADSWIDVKGEGYTIEDNEGNHSLLDGIQLHYVEKAKVGGCENKIIHDKCAGLGKGGKCVNDSSKVCEGSKKNVIEE